jgi:FkbM family methyltransferase
MHLYDILENRFVKEIYLANEYPKSEGVVIDVGALNGEYALYTYNTASRIICIEPNPQPAIDLAAKVKEYGLSKITVVQAALTKMCGEGYISNTDVPGGNVITDHRDGIVVKFITLEKLMEEQKIERIDMLKLDIEGHEHELFLDPQFPWSKIKYMCGEHIDIKDVREHGFEYSDKKHGIYRGSL